MLTSQNNQYFKFFNTMYINIIKSYVKKKIKSDVYNKNINK
jgi:hypothetical protein